MKTVIKWVLAVVVFSGAVHAQGVDYISLVKLEPNKSVLVCFMNEWMFPTEITEYIPIEDTIYPLKLVKNKSDKELFVGLKLSNFTSEQVALFIKNSGGEIQKNQVYNAKTLKSDSVELSYLPYRHEQISEQSTSLKFVQLIKTRKDPRPAKKKLLAKESRIIFIIGDFDQIRKSFKIPNGSAFSFENK